MKNTFLVCALTISTLGILSCTKVSEQDKLASAQKCMDTATPDTVAACISKVEGLESEGAYLIRCVGKFVEEGFNDTSRILTAISELDSGGTDDQTLGIMTQLTFSTSTAADQALNYCQTANAAGLVRLASLSSMATAIGDQAACLSDPDGCDESEIEAGLSNPAIYANPTVAASVGNAANSAYQTNCVGVETPDAICQEFSEAITTAGNGASSAKIGCLIMVSLGTGDANDCTSL